MKKKSKKPAARKKAVKKPAKKKKGGRPAAYDQKYAGQAKTLRGTYGVTIVTLAKMWGVTEKTIYDWMKKHRKFAEAMEEGNVFTPETIKKVKKGLLKRALGYKFKEVTSEPALLITVKVNGKKRKGAKGATVEDIEESLVPTKIVTKEVPADVTAQKLILFNKCSKEFKDRQFHDVKHGGSVKLNINVKKNYDGDRNTN